jgi:hypothetical protein
MLSPRTGEEQYVNGVLNHCLPDSLSSCLLLIGSWVFTLYLISDLSISHFLWVSFIYESDIRKETSLEKHVIKRELWHSPWVYRAFRASPKFPKAKSTFGFAEFLLELGHFLYVPHWTWRGFIFRHLPVSFLKGEIKKSIPSSDSRSLMIACNLS